MRYDKATSMRIKATAVEGIKPCWYQNKSQQQPWTAVSAFSGLVSMAQLADELWRMVGLWLDDKAKVKMRHYSDSGRRYK